MTWNFLASLVTHGSEGQLRCPALWAAAYSYTWNDASDGRKKRSWARWWLLMTLTEHDRCHVSAQPVPEYLNTKIISTFVSQVWYLVAVVWLAEMWWLTTHLDVTVMSTRIYHFGTIVASSHAPTVLCIPIVFCYCKLSSILLNAQSFWSGCRTFVTRQD